MCKPNRNENYKEKCMYISNYVGNIDKINSSSSIQFFCDDVFNVFVYN